MRRFLQLGGVLLALAFLGMQFIQPKRTNPPIVAANVLQPPRYIQPILKRACYDCHSSATHWPWYSYIAPMSWRVVHDVDEGRDELSFSEWNTYNPDQRAHLLEEICDVAEDGEMPLKPYTLLHPSAKLTIEDKRALCVWTDSLLPPHRRSRYSRGAR
ncbi:MAG TPA: heme-binding domain-containing protein [Thermoanaerobaculia bacterium]|nr:heme-binding domain-containing protein [Thermoanaerobaculia bacterium]